MKKLIYKRRFIFFPLMGVAFLSLVSLVVMLLWNNLLPDILHVSAISFWQAMGIFILCKILFGFGKGGKGGPPWMRRRMEERVNAMSPEERQKFKEEMELRMCSWKRRKTYAQYDEEDTVKEQARNHEPEN